MSTTHTRNTHPYRLRRTGPSVNPPGRPCKWTRILALRERGIKKKLGPYRNVATAFASAAYFNRQMRTNPYYIEESARLVFKARGLYVVLRRRKAEAV